MKKLLLILLVAFISTHYASGQDIIKLDGSQSMCIAGKGPGQDGAINPYLDTDSIGIVENMGENEFSIRIQKKGEILETIAIRPMEIKEVELLKGHVLYFDSEARTMAKVSFRKLSN